MTANGRSHGIPPGIPLDRFLATLGMDPSWVVVELNGEPVARAAMAGTRLDDGDRLEIVHAVAGG